MKTFAVTEPHAGATDGARQLARQIQVAEQRGGPDLLEAQAEALWHAAGPRGTEGFGARLARARLGRRRFGLAVGGDFQDRRGRTLVRTELPQVHEPLAAHLAEVARDAAVVTD